MFTTTEQQEFDNTIESFGLRYFKPYEFLEKGHQHSMSTSFGHNLNDDPTQDLWDNIKQTAIILDELRHRLKSPIRISSAYRTQRYNKVIGGEKRSLHLKFNAIDFAVRGSTMSPQDWASVLRQIRQQELFRGGIGVYPTFVHIDTRGQNVDWGQ